MASSFRQWESDPLFSAAEVVQDSADRMESLFRLLLHEQSLVQEDHPDAKLLKSIVYHKRDLATTLETAKWQLEDFEREVNLSATLDKSHTRENVISRHRQFIGAISEQILNVEKSLVGTPVGDLLKSTKWVNLDEQDRLALFLSGENPKEQVTHHDLEDSNILRRFLDPTTACSSNDEIVEHKTCENLNINGFVHLDHNIDLMENKLRKVGSHYSTQTSVEEPPSLREAASDRHGEDGSWDLEANEATGKSFFHKNKLRGYYSRMNVFVQVGITSTTKTPLYRLLTGKEVVPPLRMFSAFHPGHSGQLNQFHLHLLSGLANVFTPKPFHENLFHNIHFSMQKFSSLNSKLNIIK